MDYLIELFGTAASVVVAISLTMKNLKWLRLLNLIGSAAFASYGFVIGSLPVTVLNCFIVLIDGYYLYVMRSRRQLFETIDGDPYASPYIQRFLEHYRDDIAKYQPEFSIEPGRGWLSSLVLRDLVPVSLVVYRPGVGNEVEIALDYATPGYRDLSSARYYFGAVAERIAEGRRAVLVAKASVPAHKRYLERMGFAAASAAGRASPDSPAEYRKAIDGTSSPS